MIEFDNAYYIKLGSGGRYEHDCIENNRIRFGYTYVSLNNLNTKDKEKIHADCKNNFKDKGTATRKFNEIMKIIHSTEKDLWITFHGAKLYWTKFTCEEIKEDYSRYFELQNGWKNTDINSNLLFQSEIPGSISKIQAFRGTVCDVKNREILYLILNDLESEELKEVKKAKRELAKAVEKGLGELHWKDFEILVDLIFKESGLKRISSLGETLRFIDLELIDTLTNERYLVQVKSESNLDEYQYYLKEFEKISKDYRKMYYVVHKPDEKLRKQNYRLNNFELMLPDLLAEKIVDFGLVDWICKKIP